MTLVAPHSQPTNGQSLPARCSSPPSAASPSASAATRGQAAGDGAAAAEALAPASCAGAGDSARVPVVFWFSRGVLDALRRGFIAEAVGASAEVAKAASTARFRGDFVGLLS